MANLIPYDHEPYTIDEAEEDYKQGAGKTNYVKLDKGANKLRVLPRQKGKPLYDISTEHASKLLGAGKFVKFVCPSGGKANGECPVCDEEERLSRTGNPLDRDRAYELRAKKIYRTVVVQRGREDEGPLVWEITQKTILDDLRKMRVNEDIGGDYSDANNGFDLIVTKEEKDGNTRYSVNPARNSTPLSTDVDLALEWLENRPDVRKMIYTKTFDEMMKAVHGEDGEDDRPSQRRQLPGRRDGGDERKSSGSSRGSSSQGQRRRTAQDDLGDE